MKALDFNAAKIKVIFEWSRAKNPGKEDLAGPPTIKKISDKEIFFEEKYSRNQLQYLKKIVIFIYSLGKWKEYQINSFCFPERDLDPMDSAEKQNGSSQSSNLLLFMIEDNDKAAFRNDMRLA